MFKSRTTRIRLGRKKKIIEAYLESGAKLATTEIYDLCRGGTTLVPGENFHLHMHMSRQASSCPSRLALLVQIED